MKVYVVLEADSTTYGRDNIVGIYLEQEAAEASLPKRRRGWFGIEEWDTETQQYRDLDIPKSHKLSQSNDG
jgi:hypothetical protein